MKFDHRFALVEAAPSYRVYAADGVTMRLDFLDHILRVALLRGGEPLLPTWSVCPGGGELPLEGRDKLSTDGFSLAAPDIYEDENVFRFTLSPTAADWRTISTESSATARRTIRGAKKASAFSAWVTRAAR